MNVCEMRRSQGSDLMLGETEHQYLRKERCLKKRTKCLSSGKQEASGKVGLDGSPSREGNLGTDKCGSLETGKICFL